MASWHSRDAANCDHGTESLRSHRSTVSFGIARTSAGVLYLSPVLLRSGIRHVLEPVVAARSAVVMQMLAGGLREVSQAAHTARPVALVAAVPPNVNVLALALDAAER